MYSSIPDSEVNTASLFAVDTGSSSSLHEVSITSESVKEHVGDTVKVDGYANCHIETTEKEFDLLYMSTNIGFIHTGSVIFIESFTDYYGEVDTFRIASIKAKNGTAYKAVPMLGGVMPVEDDDNTNDLPFN